MKMNVSTLSCLCLAALCCALLGEHAQAQSGFGSSEAQRFKNRNSGNRYSSQAIQNRVQSRSIGSVGVAGVNRRNFGGGSQRSKPFKDLNRGPSVSPYLALSGSLNGVSDYYNTIRPQQRQARANSQMQRQTMANSRQINQMSSAGPYSLQGDPYMSPTGHSATYMNFSSFQQTGNFFPRPQGLNKRR
jgi:hypothetical protein